MKRRAVLVTAVVAFGAVGAAPARADQTPAGCSKNALALDISKDKTIVRQGDVVTYGISIGNASPGGGECNYTGVSVDFAVPGGQPQVVATNLNLPAGTALHQIATVQYTVPAVSSPVDLVPHGHAVGTLHDAAVNHAGEVTKSVGTTAFVPAMALTKTGSTTAGVAPQTVTFTYTLTNTSPVSADLPNIPIAGPAVSDNLCAPLSYVAGDANANTLLDVGETWTYTCTTAYKAAGCYTNVATASGTVTTDNRPTSAGPASWTVCVTPPKSAVKGASASSRCVTLPSRSLKVRARELSTVRVRVRLNGKNIAKSLVHVRGAGVSKTARTNKHGMVTFRLRPKKTGRIRISSDQCAVAARLSVKPARQVVSPALPEVTG